MAASHKHRIFWSLCAAFAAYSAYVYTAGTRLSENRPLTRQVKAGLALFQENNCIACHQFYGLGGYMGPDLTNVTSAPNKGVSYAKAFLQSGTSRMPNFELSEAQIDALVRFLEFVDATGDYPPKRPEISWYGTVDYDAGRDGQ